MNTAATTQQAPDYPITHSHPNPIRGRFNAAFFRFMDWYMHWKYRRLKRALFETLPSTVVELGAGTGPNFRYLEPGTHVIAIEPNEHMHADLRRNATRRGLTVDVRNLKAEGLPLGDASVEAIICSLVLCTVCDPGQVLREVRRVLKPGGRFICIEHVAAPRGSLLGRIQRALFRPWRWLFEGCHTHRDTATELRQAGFADVQVSAFTLRSVFVPVRPHIAAVCTK